MGNLPRLDPMRQPPPKPHKLESRTVRGVELAEDVTVTPATHTHTEAEIADGALLARLAADEQITGNWRVAGIDGEFIPQSSSGAPTHSAGWGTLYVDLATGDLYVNSNGATTWLKIGPGGAGAHDIDGASHTDKDTIASTWTLIAGGVFKCTSHATAPTGEIIPQIKTTTGAPTHSASEGTFCWNSVDNKFYINNNGTTGWTEIGAGGAHAASHAKDGTDELAAQTVEVTKLETATITPISDASANDLGIKPNADIGSQIQIFAYTAPGGVPTWTAIFGSAGGKPVFNAAAADPRAVFVVAPAPLTDAGADLGVGGGTPYRFKDLYLSGNLSDNTDALTVAQAKEAYDLRHAQAHTFDSHSDVSAITEAQGQVIYWNGSNWVALAPGTSGKYLKTLGAGANPMWDTPAGGAALTVQEEDGTPIDTAVTIIRVPNGGLVDNGAGDVSLGYALPNKKHSKSLIFVYPDNDLATGTFLPQTAIRVPASGKHGTWTPGTAYCRAVVAGSGTNTILFRTSSTYAGARTTRATIALGTALEASAAITWTPADGEYCWVECSAVGATAPQGVEVQIDIEETEF